MTFTSVSYFVFLTLAWLSVLGSRKASTKQVLLLAASYIFYASWTPWFLLVLVLSSLGNFGWGRLIRRHPRPAALWGGLVFNILLLGSFKYLGWVLPLAGAQPYIFRVIAPVGLSFYSFQAMSYLLDVYRRGEDTNPSLQEFLLYLAFWPTVLAGPVTRIGEMVPQFGRLDSPTREDVVTGASRIVLGLFMKVVVADSLKFGITPGTGVDSGFAHTSAEWSGIDVWFLAAGYGFQLFCDFAGYSHIAIGCARLFGLHVRENFDAPYTSRSATEFWTRWHMSLSFWIRDYLFFPLATMHRALWWRHVALILSMMVFGLWHGPSVLFILWGAYHGVLLVTHRLFQQAQRAAGTGLLRLAHGSPVTRGAAHLAAAPVTFLLVTLGWILFRANSPDQAAAMLQAALSPGAYLLPVTLPVQFILLVLIVAGGYFAYVTAVAYAARRLEGQPSSVLVPSRPG